MESQGWKLIVVERAEDEEWDIDRTWDEIEGEEYFDDYDDDEYNIDNDSDFWRRATDQGSAGRWTIEKLLRPASNIGFVNGTTLVPVSYNQAKDDFRP